MSLDDDDFKSSFPRFGSLDDAHVTAPARHVTIVLGSGEKLSISVRALEPCALLAGAIQGKSHVLCCGVLWMISHGLYGTPFWE